MTLRRSLAAVLAAGSLLLAGCAGDDLDSGSDNETSKARLPSWARSSISGQNFPEAALMAAMYSQLLEDAGYEPDVKLVDSRDGYMPIFPSEHRRRARVRRRHRQLPQLP